MNLFNELKRRNVFRVAAAYLVISWLLVQVLGLAASSFEAPIWVMKMIITLLAIGFIPAILFSWAYELTPEGLKKDSEVDHTTSKAPQMSNKLNVITLIAVIGVIGLFFYQQYNPVIHKSMPESAIENTITETPIIEDSTANDSNVIDDASIAVLPFADLSPAGDQEYFSDGMAEEILNVLVRVDHLKVASRTSAFGFKGQEALGIPLIAEKLQVRHVLEGSVRKAGDTVRITAQLIDAQTDQHLWSQTYDRPLTAENIFTIQDEVSSEIVKALRNHLSVELGDAQTVNFDTENISAYELYLKARQLFFVRSTENIPEIIALAKQATELDPNFAQAWAGLAAAYTVATSWNVPGDDHDENALFAAKKAIELNPNVALAYAVLQNNQNSKKPMDFVQSIAYSDQALSLDPNNSTAQFWRGIDELVLGFFDKAGSHFEKCLKIDPVYQNCRRFLALSKLYAGQTAAAFKLFDQGIAAGSTSQVDPFSRSLLTRGDYQAGLYLMVYGNTSLPSILPNDVSFRRWTDPNFNFEQEFLLLKSDYEAKTKQPFNFSELFLGDLIAYTFKQYDKISPEYHGMFWWEKTDPEFIKSPHRKRLIRELGIFDYWLKTEFPPQCKPIGEDDFECD